MNLTRIIFIITLVFWLVVGGVIVRTNRLWFGPVTFTWRNLSQPSAMFRWTIPPSSSTVVIPANTTRSIKIQVPKKFAAGELSISTATGGGGLTVNINAPTGTSNITGSTPAGGVVTLPLRWDQIAVQTRAFNVDIMTDDFSAEILAVTLRLQ